MSGGGPLDFGSGDGEQPERDAEEIARERREREREEELRWAHRRDPDLDVTRRDPDAPMPVPRPPGMSRYSWFVGVAAVLAIAAATINSLGNDGRGSLGIRAGERLPPFAAPLALSSLDGDANLSTGGEGRRSACSLRGASILNSCDLWAKGPVALVFFGDRSERCVRQLDTVERVRDRFPGINFAAVAIRGDRAKLRELIRRRGWDFPVAYDRDGQLANYYGVAVCPQVTFARRGGRAVDTTFGELDATDLAAQLRRLTELERSGGGSVTVGG